MDEARSLTYSINVRADTSQAESNLRNITSSIGSLNNNADSIGSAFRKSFLAGIDSGNSFSSSIRSGVKGAFEQVGNNVTEFKNNVVSTAQTIGNGFAHPISTIKNGLGNALQNARDRFINMAREAENSADEIEELGEASNNSKGDVKNLGDAAENSGSKFEKLGSIVKTTGLAITAALGIAVGAVGAFAGSAVNTGMEFDSAMSQISATMGMTSSDIANNINGAGDTFDALRNKAKEMGAATNFSATQAAEGLNILAMSGYDATSSMDMIEDVLHLAAAGGMDMAQSADFIAGSMKGFNDETKSASYYADLMAKGATLANTSVTELGEAISGGAATAAAYGQSADGMTLSLLRLAEQGVAGSAASTALNAAMKDLYTPTDNAKKALSELGIAVYDENGKAREFNTVVDELNGALADMSDEEANVYKSTIFQIQGLQAFNKMTVTSAEKQEEWAAALAEASGEASRQYDTMTDNLQGDIDIWNSALDGFKIALSDELTPTIREFVKFGSDSMGKLTEAFEVGGISGAMDALGEILNAGLEMVIGKVPDMVDAGMQLLGALGQGLLDNLPLIVDSALQIVTTVGDGLLKALPKVAEAAIIIISTLASGIGSALPTLIPTVVDTVITVVDTLIENMPLLLDAGMQLLSGLTQGIIDAIPLLVERLPELIISFVGFITENLPTIIEQGAGLVLNLAMGLINAIPLLVEQLPALITSIVGFVTENLPTIIETGINLVVQLGLGLIQAIPQLVAQLPQIIAAIIDGLADLPGMMLEIGGNLVKGLWEGIQGLAGWIWDQISGWASSIWDGICGFFGIHSPSTEMAWVGEMLVDGLAGSIDKNGDEAVDAALGMADGIVSAFDDVSDVGYNVKPIVEDFNPPDVSAAMIYGTGSEEATTANADSMTSSADSNESGTVIAFSPVININVSGDVSEEGVANISESLRETVRQLFMEFREEELERMALKQQYAF